jgi:colanic acid/amylovoran biosynthesis glycosyltransferase
VTRIGYLVPDWPTQTHAFFWRELVALREAGCEASVFSTRRPPVEACQHDFAAAARRETYYLHPPRLSAVLGLLWRPRRLAAAIGYVAGLKEATLLGRMKVAAMLGSAADLAARADADGIEHVHAHSCANSAHLLAMASRLGSFGYSLTLHGDLPVYGNDHPAKMRDARFVAAVTRPLQQQIIADVGVPEARVPIIPMGVDSAHFTPAARKQGDGPLHIVTVARLNPTKGHRFVLAAMRKARENGIDIHYSIAGDGPERDTIAAKITACDLDGHVEFLGNLGEREVRSLLQRADVFVLASIGLGEAAPVSVMEAMACGTPVICSRIGGTGDMIAHGVNGWLVDQGDVDGLADAITILGRDGELRARLASAARAHAETAFDHRAMAGRLLAAIEGVPETGLLAIQSVSAR